MHTCIYPGTFDPITKGHTDIISRASNVCGNLIIAIYNNRQKKCMFSLDDRFFMVEKIVKYYKNVKIVTFDTLLVDLALKYDTCKIVRGIRNANDFEYEQNLFQINKTLYSKFETLFLIAKNDYKHISSSVVRELIRLKGDFSHFIDEPVYEFIQEKFN